MSSVQKTPNKCLLFLLSTVSYWLIAHPNFLCLKNCYKSSEHIKRYIILLIAYFIYFLE